MDAQGLLYPVISRRSGGLSLGVELFPGGKKCNFDCPYCEIFPSTRGLSWNARDFESEMESFLDLLPSGAVVRDLCLSGSGEPTLSPSLGEALGICAAALAPRSGPLAGAGLVLITNASRLGEPHIASLLRSSHEGSGLEIWAKLDAVTERGFRAMGGAGAFRSHMEGLRVFASRVPVVLQTMLCELDGVAPDVRYASEYGAFVLGLADSGAKLTRIDLYTKARPSPGARARAVPDADLVSLAKTVHEVACAPLGLRLRAFGSSGGVFDNIASLR